MAGLWLIPLYILGGMYGYYVCAVSPNMSGDLGKLGKIPFGNEYAKRLSQTGLHDNMVRGLPASGSSSGGSGKILTIGDSFSQAGKEGYQNFLAHRLGEEVTNLNLPIGEISPIDVSVGLINSGFFDGRKDIEFVVVECVERNFVDDFLEADMNYRVDNLDEITRKKQPAAGPDPSKTDFKQARDWALIHSGLADSPVLDLALSKRLFTLEGKEDRLYFYADDLDRTDLTASEMKTVEEKIKWMEARLADNGIQLIVVAVPDKYEIYQDFAAGNPYPRKNVGNRLLELDSLGYFIFPMLELKGLLSSGVTDVYLANDTHWSATGAGVLGRQIADRVNLFRNK